MKDSPLLKFMTSDSFNMLLRIKTKKKKKSQGLGRLYTDADVTILQKK